jgi:anti-anti-sigma factor
MTDQAVFSSTHNNGVPVLDIRGEVDILNAGELRSAIQAAALHGTGPLIVSLSHVAYFDSQTLEILVEFTKRMALNRRLVVLVAPPGSPPRKLLEVSGIGAVIGIYSSVDEAVAAVEPGKA